MRTRLFYLILFICSGYCAGAQELKLTSYYMQLESVSQTAKDFHSGKATLNTDIIHNLCDSLYTSSDDTRPFYIYLVSKILLNHSSSLPEEMPVLCMHYIQNNPSQLMDLIFSKGVKRDYKNAWVSLVAKGIQADCRESVLQCFKTSRLLALEFCDERQKPQLESVYLSIRSALDVHKH